MNDPNHRVTQALHDLAVRAPVAGGITPRVRRRARIAMARTALGAVIVVGLAATGGIAAFERLGDPRVAGPVAPPAPPPEEFVYVSDRDGDNDIYSTTIGGGAGTNLTQNGASDSSPSWSPDGTQIAFSSDRAGTVDVYVMGADGTGVRRVMENGVDPEWSPDGTAIAFGRAVLTSPNAPALSQIFVVDLASDRIEQVTHAEGGALHAAWSPDGRRLAYSSLGRILVSDSTGRDDRRITEGPLDMTPVWARDGSSLLFSRETSMQGDHVTTGVFSVGATGGGNPTAVTALDDRSVEPESFSTDGRRVLVTVYDGGRGDVYLMDADGRDLTPMVEGPFDDASAAWRPGA